MRKAVFLDRDGTINRDTGYVRTVKEFRFLPRAKEAIGLLKRHGFFVFVVSNQSGIGRGYMSAQAVDEIHRTMEYRLARCGVNLDGVVYCPHHPQDKCQSGR